MSGWRRERAFCPLLPFGQFTPEDISGPGMEAGR
jgi:hypothetical protein